MSAQLYDIYFSGKTLEGTDPTAVKQKLARIFNTEIGKIEHLFSGGSVKVKGGVDQETAIKYRVAFRNAGALVEIHSADPVAGGPHRTSSAVPETQTRGEAEMTLLPPRTGSLIDCAPVIEAAPLPDISSLSLVSAGVPLDETPRPEAPRIDTDGLELAPAHTGSLEDFQIRKQPAELPDISQLAIVDPED